MVFNFQPKPIISLDNEKKIGVIPKVNPSAIPSMKAVGTILKAIYKFKSNLRKHKSQDKQVAAYENLFYAYQ